MSAKGIAAVMGAAYFILLMPVFPLFGKNESGVPRGMEIIKTGDLKVIVPKGSHVTEEGSRFSPEPIDEYVARRFADMDDELKSIKDEQARLKEKIARLEKFVEGSEKKKDEEVGKK